jgi:hypothetical protein
MRSRIGILAATVFISTAALAHEFWLEPPRFRLAPGATANIHTFIGADFVGQSWTTKATKVLRLVRYGPAPADSTNLTPQNAAETDSFQTDFYFRQPGTHVVLMRSTNSFLELPADQFTAYLREEGLDYALKLRQEPARPRNLPPLRQSPGAGGRSRRYLPCHRQRLPPRVRPAAGAGARAKSLPRGPR